MMMVTSTWPIPTLIKHVSWAQYTIEMPLRAMALSQTPLEHLKEPQVPNWIWRHFAARRGGRPGKRRREETERKD